MFYSSETRGFYLPSVHGNNMPADALEISGEQYSALMEQMEAGKQIVPGADGYPCAVDRAQPTGEQAAERERAWRDAQLLQYGGIRDRHRDEVELGIATTLTAEQYTELLTLLQALRDWPQSELFPDSEQRPAPPTWLIELTQ